jgi:hypothetical protein
MKLTMKVIPLALLAATVAVSSVALAGLVASGTVVVNTSGKYAYGALSAARYSSDSKQYIGCFSSSTGGSTTAVCQAQDANSNYLSCQTTNSGMIQQIATLGVASEIQFGADSSGNCSYIDTWTYSYLIH